MTLQQVLQSKKAFKRRAMQKLIVEFNTAWCPLYKGENVYDQYAPMSIQDLLAEDWEIEEEAKPFTKPQIFNACEKALIKWEKSDRDLGALIIEELGF